MADFGRLVMVGLLVVVAVGCVAKVDRVVFDSGAKRDIRRILILESARPTKIAAGPPHAIVLGGGTHGLAVLALLPISAAISIDSAIKSKTIADLAAQAALDLDARLATTLADELVRAGFEVSRQKVAPEAFNWPGNFRSEACSDLRWPETYVASGSVDVVLDVRLLPTGFARFGDTHGTVRVTGGLFTPYSGICVRLVDARTQAILYLESFVLADGTSLGRGTAVPTNPSARFADFDALEQRHEFAFEVLRDGIERAARLIAADLVPARR